MNPNIKQLEALYWAGRLGSFQAAANRLHTTQSAISKRIAELEEDFGKKLFDRSRRNAQLTPAGERISVGAEELLALASRVFADLPDADEPEGFLRLGTTELVAMSWLPTLLQHLKRDFPRLRIEVQVRNGGVLLDQMNNGQYDVAILPGPMWGRIYETVPLQPLERAWMASPAMAIPRRVLSVEELSKYPIATQFSDTIHAQLQSAWFTKAGFPQRSFVQADSFTVLGRMAIEGIAIAHLPVSFYSNELRSKVLTRIRVEPALPSADYFAIFRRNSGSVLASEVARAAAKHCNFKSARRHECFSEVR